MSYSSKRNFQKHVLTDIVFDKYLESLSEKTSTSEVCSSRGLYDLLQILPNSSMSEIKESYKKLILKNHPDKGGSSEIFTKIRRAFTILSDPETRHLYDEYGDNFEGNILIDIYHCKFN